MRGLSEDTDLSFLVRQTLIQACFGPHDLILRFQGERDIDSTISIWSSLGRIDKTGSNHRIEDFKLEAEFILSKLNQRIVEVKILPRGTISLRFEVETQVEIYDDSDQYEPYSIHHAGKAIQV